MRSFKAMVLLAGALLIPACGGSPKTSAGGGPGNDPAVPSFIIAGGTGTSTMTASSGASTTAPGPVGGAITIQGQSGSDVHVLKGSLVVDTQFTVPVFQVNVGSNPRTISTAVTVNGDGSGMIPGDNALVPATGLHVTSTGILTLGPALGTPTQGFFGFSEGIQIDSGAQVLVPQAAGSNDALALQINCSEYQSAPGSSLSSQPAAGNGGTPDGGAGSTITVNCSGTLISQGSVVITGGDTAQPGAQGGAGGVFQILTFSGDAYFTGPITSNGGASTGTGGKGGVGGGVSLISQTRALFTRSVITCNGTSAEAKGGASSVIQFGTQGDGQVLVGGSITAKAGDATAAGGLGGDASGGGIQITSSSGILRVSADLITTGGAGMTTGAGGPGGPITVKQLNQTGGASYVPSSGIVAGGVSISGTLDTRGGAGSTGGKGGDILIASLMDNASSGLNPITVAGYLSITSSGSDGNGGGGVTGSTGGTILIENLIHTDPSGQASLGGIDNNVDLTAVGGAPGGTGGTIVLSTAPDAAGLPNPARSVVNAGHLNVSGGGGTSATVPAGGGGLIQIYDEVAATNNGPLTLDGGANSASAAGPGGTAMILSNHQATNSGTVSTVGGTGFNGGNGGALKVEGSNSPSSIGSTTLILGGFLPNSSAVNSGVLTATGGDATGASGSGGSGGTLLLYDHALATSTGAVSSSGGAGGPSGTGGQGGLINLLSDGQVVSAVGSSPTTDYEINGGSASGAGSLGGFCRGINIVGQSVSHSGSINGNGGNGETGSSGAVINLNSTRGLSTVHGVFSIKAGTSSAPPTTPPSQGLVMIDGVDRTPPTGVGGF